MTLGEKIYELRMKNNLSQEALAEAMGVSRQSVSKWETNASVPDLDKLLKLSDLFGVTLDELARGAENPAAAEPQNAKPAAKEKLPRRKAAGLVLFVLGYLTFMFFFLIGGFSTGLVWASPFLVSGLICFIFRENVGLWCAWAVFILVDGYMRCYTTLEISLNAQILLRYGPDLARLIVLCIQLVWIFLLIAAPVRRFGRKPLEMTKGNRLLLVSGAAAFLLLHIPISVPWDSRYVALIFGTVDWGKMILFTALLTNFLRLYHGKKEKAEENGERG